MNASQAIVSLQKIKQAFKQTDQSPKKIDATLGKIGVLDNNAYYQNSFTNYLNVKRIAYSEEIINTLSLNANHSPQDVSDIQYLQKHPSEFAHILNVKQPLKPSDVFDAIDDLITKLKEQHGLANQNYNFKLQDSDSTMQDLKAKTWDKIHMGLWIIAVIIFIWLCWKLIEMLF